MSNNFGARLRWWRKRRGLSQLDLAGAAGTSQNAGAQRLTTFLTAPTPDPAPTGTVNLAEWLLSPDGLRPLLVNWQDVAIHFLRGVQADAIADGTPDTAALLQRLLAYPGIPALSQVPALEEPQPPVLAMHFRQGDMSAWHTATRPPPSSHAWHRRPRQSSIGWLDSVAAAGCHPFPNWPSRVQSHYLVSERPPLGGALRLCSAARQAQSHLTTAPASCTVLLPRA